MQTVILAPVRLKQDPGCKFKASWGHLERHTHPLTTPITNKKNKTRYWFSKSASTFETTATTTKKKDFSCLSPHSGFSGDQEGWVLTLASSRAAGDSELQLLWFRVAIFRLSRSVALVLPACDQQQKPKSSGRIWLVRPCLPQQQQPFCGPRAACLHFQMRDPKAAPIP